MTGEAQLILLAEIAIALAGFAGIVATNQFRSTGRFSRGDAVGLVLIIHCGLVDAFFTLLPMAIFAFGHTEQTAFRFSSALHCINFSLYIYWIVKNMRSVRVNTLVAHVSYALLYIVAGFIIVINAMNAVGWVFHGEFGPYFVACILPLLLAAYMFIRLVSRPIWRSVWEHEKSMELENRA
jgi:hypothetical protein